MIRYIKIIALFIVVSCMLTIPALAKSKVLTRVKVIHASSDSNQVDPQIASIISEYKSVFRYTSYRLITSQSLNLGFKQNGRVSLPGKRTLVITPVQMQGSKISYQISILKGNRSVFNTLSHVNNNSSVTIGGPQFKNGVIILNISGSAR